MDSSTKTSKKLTSLKPKSCPNCQEPNKIDSKFCSKCRMVLSYDSYTELVQEKQETLAEKYEKLDAKIDAIARQFLTNNVTVGTSDSDELDRRPMTEEEIQQVLNQRRMRENMK
jgi:hypothetical protein